MQQRVVWIVIRPRLHRSPCRHLNGRRMRTRPVVERDVQIDFRPSLAEDRQDRAFFLQQSVKGRRKVRAERRSNDITRLRGEAPRFWIERPGHRKLSFLRLQQPAERRSVLIAQIVYAPGPADAVKPELDHRLVAAFIAKTNRHSGASGGARHPSEREARRVFLRIGEGIAVDQWNLVFRGRPRKKMLMARRRSPVNPPFFPLTVSLVKAMSCVMWSRKSSRTAASGAVSGLVRVSDQTTSSKPRNACRGPVR